MNAYLPAKHFVLCPCDIVLYFTCLCFRWHFLLCYEALFRF